MKNTKLSSHLLTFTQTTSISGALLCGTLLSAHAQTTPAAPGPATPGTGVTPGTPAVGALGITSAPALGITPDTPTTADAGTIPVSVADQRNQAAEQSSPLLLEEALVLALKNSPLRASARAGLAAAQARIGTARSARGLQVNLGASETLSYNIAGGGAFGGTGGADGGGINIGAGGSSGGGNAGGFPTTGVGTRQTPGGNPGQNPGGGNGQNGGATPDLFGSTSPYAHNESLSLSASIPLYTGGRVRASTRQAEAAALSQAAQTLQTESDVLLATTNAYLGVLRAGQLLDVSQSNLDIARERRRVAGVRLAAGAAARLEVLTADTILANAAQQRINASNSLAQNKATLNTLIGRNPESPLRVEPIATLIPRIPLMIGTAAQVPPASSDVPAFPGTSAPAVTGSGTAAPDTAATPGTAATGGAITRIESLSTMSSVELRALTDRSRASLQSAQQQVNIAQAGVDLARAQRRPSVGLSLSNLLRNPVSAFVSRFGVLLGLNVAQNLFDSGRTRSQVEEARATVVQAQENFRNQRLNLYNQIEQALLQFDSAEKSVNSADTGVVSAQEAVRAAQLGYQAGARTSLEVNQAQADLLQAQTASVNARFDAAIAQVLLAATVGIATETGRTAYEQALREEAQRVLSTQTTPPVQQVKAKRRR